MEPVSHRSQVLLVLSALTGGFFILSNFLGAKVWSCFGLVLDGGVLVFPILYVISDALVELYGRRTADQVALWASITNLIGLVACFLADCLPGLPGEDNLALSSAFGLSARVMLASTVAFLLSNFTNNWLFEIIRTHTKHEEFAKRSLGSSLLAHIVDTGIFTLIAFAGRYGFDTLLIQMFSSFAVAILLEALLNPLAKFATFRLQRYIDAPSEP